MNFAWAKTPADHMDQYADIVGSSQGRGVPAGMMIQMQRHASYIKTKLTPEEHAKLHKNISAHANRLMKDDEISAEEANKIKSIYTPSRVDESKNVSHLQEKLSASDPASVWISHFVNSDNPKFSGKSKEQRRQMALGAYYAAKKEGNDMSEESKISFSAFRQKLDEKVLSLLPEAELDEARNPNFDRLVQRGRLFRNEKPTPGEVETLKGQIKDTNARGGLPGPQRKLPEETETQTASLKESVSVAKAAAIEAHKKGMNLSQAEDHIYDTVIRHYSGKSEGAGGLMTRIRIDQNTDIGLAHFKKLSKQSGNTSMGEETEDQHYCAKHVYSEVFGEGVVVEGQHADPDENGNIEWYTVQFDHGEEVIFTEDVEVMMAEYHNNHSPMKKKAKKAKE